VPQPHDPEALYQERLVDHYEDPYHLGVCAGATHAAECQGAAGTAIAFSLRIENGRILEAWFEGVGSSTSQALASMLCETLEGRTVDEVWVGDEDDPGGASGCGRWLDALGVPADEQSAADCQVVCEALLRTLNTPLDDEQTETYFQGPNLGEEC
jgi:nitrogen fixation protein NifU and related proteins